jgi:hypothetical protein
MHSNVAPIDPVAQFANRLSLRVMGPAVDPLDNAGLIQAAILYRDLGP